jgi:hypothetical protein
VFTGRNHYFVPGPLVVDGKIQEEKCNYAQVVQAKCTGQDREYACRWLNYLLAKGLFETFGEPMQTAGGTYYNFPPKGRKEDVTLLPCTCRDGQDMGCRHFEGEILASNYWHKTQGQLLDDSHMYNDETNTVTELEARIIKQLQQMNPGALHYYIWQRQKDVEFVNQIIKKQDKECLYWSWWKEVCALQDLQDLCGANDEEYDGPLSDEDAESDADSMSSSEFTSWFFHGSISSLGKRTADETLVVAGESGGNLAGEGCDRIFKRMDRSPDSASDTESDIYAQLD